MPLNCSHLQLLLDPPRSYFDNIHNQHISQERDDATDPSDNDDLGPEIYDDLVLLPPRPTRSNYISSLSKPSLIRAPYLPPEIIGRICSFSSHQTLVKSIRLVSRDWRAVAILYIGKRYMWYFQSQKEEDELLYKMRLGSDNILVILHRFQTPKDRTPPYDQWPAALEKFWRAIITPSLEKDDEGNSPIVTTAMDLRNCAISETSLFSRVGKLVLQGQLSCDSVTLRLMLPHLSRIHTLELLPFQHVHISLLPILTSCSQLDNLIIRGQQMDHTTVVWSQEDTSLETRTIAGASFRLAYFEAETISASYNSLLNLISTCPVLREFKAQLFFLRGPFPSMSPTPEKVTIREQLRPLYKKAATLCPFLEEFLVLPVSWSILSAIVQPCYYTWYTAHVSQDSTRHTANMLLAQAYFPHLCQVSFPLTMPGPWQPSPVLCDYLSRLTHFRVIKTFSDFNNQAVDVLLRCAKSLVTLTAPVIDLWSTKYLYNEEAAEEYRNRLAARGGYLRAQLAPALRKKLYLALLRKYRAAESNWARLPHRTQWMYRNLQVVDIGVGLSSSARPADKAAVFQQLAHCCPLIVDLTIRSDGLHMGQCVRIRTTGIVLEDQSLLEAPVIRRRGQAVEDPSLLRRWRNMPVGYRSCEKYASSRVYNSVLALGGGHRYEEFDGGSGASWRDMSKFTRGKLTRLKRLCFVVQAVEGALSVRDFEFLRTKDDTRDRKHVKRASKEVYWPSLETFSLHRRTAGKLKVIPAPFDKIDSNDDRPFQEKLEGMRPGVDFRMTDAYTM